MTYSGCGISGVRRFAGSPDQRGDAAAVHRMTRALAHRGPNGEGFAQGEGVTLGHRRLSVVGLGDQGAQPMTRDGVTIVYNGELYNHRALRTELGSSIAFRSATDTEVVLQAWRRWGLAALDRFDGMFAFAVWDERDRALWLVRDRLGVKPLYYHHDVRRLVFASEVEALLHSGLVAAEPDLDVFRRQLLCSSTLDWEVERTLVGGVRSVAPGTAVRFDDDGTASGHTYWRLPESEPGPTRPRASDVEEFGGLLRAGVGGMLQADVPVSAFLSGGLDSSAIAALAAESGVVTCVTVAFGSAGEPSASGNEDLRFSEELVRALPAGRVRHHVDVHGAGLTLDQVDEVCDLAALGDDPRHPTIAANYRSVRDLGLRVVLNGQGADEVMAGYIGLPGFTRNVHDVGEPENAKYLGMPASRRAPGLSPAVLAHTEVVEKGFRDFCAGLSGAPLERAHRLLVATQLHRVLRFEDFLSMRHGVEARVPFLDHRLVEWCFSRPMELHVDRDRRRGKDIMRRSLARVLPAALLDRPKQVFPFPGEEALQASLAALVTEHRSALAADELVRELLSLPPADRIEHTPIPHLWLLLSTWRWHEKLRRIA
ncbi:asparagine synthase (glutamine-hydrolyzing) [Amycolatopsis sp. SID8362]|uniref:asparagine synthase (glutamine-hydrolyzing) n=1 Tax=Amycolatopsis sp. SID8362 TaxID=2690346 RepID=UPI001429490D|nr:asparagine synthase (glutamine-hydrolyzing) [Amycolatopsis sp. SID8362]NED41009.1 asparagine synthase (glutamine-hydrolyzing) [Amycolatopsis sp. SID8362]